MRFTSSPDLLSSMFFPRLPARLGGRDHLVGDEITIADVALASMSAPLAIAGSAVTASPAVQELLAWGRRALEIDREFESRGLSGFGPPNKAPGQRWPGAFKEA
jgi:hypothetical protein